MVTVTINPKVIESAEFIVTCSNGIWRCDQVPSFPVIGHVTGTGKTPIIAMAECYSNLRAKIVAFGQADLENYISKRYGEWDALEDFLSNRCGKWDAEEAGNE